MITLSSFFSFILFSPSGEKLKRSVSIYIINSSYSLLFKCYSSFFTPYRPSGKLIKKRRIDRITILSSRKDEKDLKSIPVKHRHPDTKRQQ